MVCLGFEPKVTKWKAQTNPLNFGSTKGLLCTAVHYSKILIRAFAVAEYIKRFVDWGSDSVPKCKPFSTR